jgi:hypothetical protein
MSEELDNVDCNMVVTIQYGLDGRYHVWCNKDDNTAPKPYRVVKIRKHPECSSEALALLDYSSIINTGGALHPEQLDKALSEWREQCVIDSRDCCQMKKKAIRSLLVYPEGDHGFNPPRLVSMTIASDQVLYELQYCSCLGSSYTWHVWHDYSGPAATIVVEVEGQIDDVRSRIALRTSGLNPELQKAIREVCHQEATVATKATGGDSVY